MRSAVAAVRPLVLILLLDAAACAGERSSIPAPPPVAMSPCRSEMALVENRFCIDRWEASLVEVTAGGERPFSPYQSPNGSAVRAVAAGNAVPQGYMSRDQADRACKASHKRLCLDEEWVMACRGDPPHSFPYGDGRQKGVCNDSGRSPLRAFYPESPETYSDGPMNDPRLNQLPTTVARSGAFARCTNGFGVFDMVGNLHEWVMSPHPTFRGGYFLDTHSNGEGCAYHTTAHAADYHDYSTGFRCCSDPARGVTGGDSFTK